MAPTLDPSVPIMLDRLRHIRLGTKALRRAELVLSDVRKREISILRVMFNPDGLGLNEMLVLLWCGLAHEDPTLTLEEVEDLVTGDKILLSLEAVYAAWNRHTASAQPSTEEASNGPLATPSPGSDSGASPVSSLAFAPASFGT
jgi:hypothetical protein